MEEDLLGIFFMVRKIRGKDEYEIYKNYINDLPRERMIVFFFQQFRDERLKVKNNLKSLHWRKRGNESYKNKNCEGSIKLYTKSLRYATYNSESYALALANRSAVFFDMEDYESCLKDIDLCLKAKYSSNLKPKVYFRKAQCYQKMGEANAMREVLSELATFLDETTTLPTPLGEKFRKKIKNMITAPAEAESDPQERFNELPVLEVNPTFQNASSSLMLKYTKNGGFHVYAQKEIALGEVVLVDKAYAFSPCFAAGKMTVKINCHYCVMKLGSCVPCKSCVKHIYCSEECRDLAWDEFHQWECIGIQYRFLPEMWVGYLALRIILKATHKGLSTDPIKFKEGVTNYGEKDDDYHYVYNLSSPLNKLRKDKLLQYAATAAVLVNYLKLKTDFFTHLKKSAAYASKSEKELMNKVGGLMIRHLAQFHWNGVIIKDYDKYETKAIDLFLTVCPSMALMNHSCDPNTTHYFVGDTVVVKAARNIKPNEELCYPYMNAWYTLVGTKMRKKMLEEVCYLNCKCQACVNPKMDLDAFDAYLCIKCNGSAISEIKVPNPEKECFCLDCNYRYLLPYDVYLAERVGLRLLADFTHGEDDVSAAYSSIEINRTILKHTHAIFKVTYEELMKHYLARGDINDFMEIGTMMISRWEELYPKDGMQIGIAYYYHCVDIMELLEEVAVTMDVEQLGKALNDFTKLIEKAKFVFNVHYPPFNVRFHKMEKRIFQFRVLHVIRLANSMGQNVQ